MFTRQSLKQFGLRFLVCLVVLGGLYLIVFGLHPGRHKLPNTPQAKILRLGTALDQTYVDSSDITGFKQNNPASYYQLSTLINKLKADTTALSTALQDAPHKVAGSEKAAIKAVIAQENDGVTALQARYTVLNQVIAYDPQADLGKLDLSNDSA